MRQVSNGHLRSLAGIPSFLFFYKAGRVLSLRLILEAGEASAAYVYLVIEVVVRAFLPTGERPERSFYYGELTFRTVCV